MFLITTKSIFQLVVLILLGILLYKLKLISKDGIKAINAVLLHLALPATLFKSFQLDILFNNRSLIAVVLGITLLYHIVLIILAYILVRKNPDAGVERAAIIFTNNGFVAVPLLSAIFGEAGLFYSSATNVVSSFLVWTMIPIMLSGEFSLKTVIRKVCNDKVAACLVAMIFLMLNIKLPEIVMTPVDYLAGMTSPLAMVSIGCVIASSDMKTMMSKRVVWISFLRLIVTPLILCLMFKLIIRNDNTLFLSFCVLGAMPSGSMIPILAEQAGLPAEKGSGIFVLTTIASAVTIPLIVLLMS